MKTLREEIPSIIRNPIQFLDKWFTELFAGKDSIEDTKKRFHKWLKKIIDGNVLLVSGRYNAWIYHHGILKRLMWLLLIHEVSTTTIKAMKRKVSGLRVPLSITSIGLAYQFPLKEAKCFMGLSV